MKTHFSFSVIIKNILANKKSKNKKNRMCKIAQHVIKTVCPETELLFSSETSTDAEVSLHI